MSAAINRLFAVGFEGFRLGDVARDVGINNATLLHHYPSKVALIRAVVESFTERFVAIADAADSDGSPRERLARHLRSSVELMRTSPEMFAVLNEIMIRARRDADISQLVSVPLKAWREHIVGLILMPGKASDAAARSGAEDIAMACMSQLLGTGLLLRSADHADAWLDPICAGTASQAIAALTHLVEEA